MTREGFAKMLEDENGGDWRHIATRKNGTEEFHGVYTALAFKARLLVKRGPFSGWKLYAPESVRGMLWAGVNRLQTRFPAWNWNA